MGRLQRKKTSGAKKKKKKSAASAAAAKNRVAADSSKKMKVANAARKKQTPAPKRLTPKKPSQVTSVAAAKPKTNFIQSSIQFLREVKIELKKVTWPSRKQTIGSTAVVLALVLIISLFLGFIDFGLSHLIRAVLQ